MVTRVGLSIPPGLSFPQWEQAGRRVTNVMNSSAWCLGDWINYGQRRYSDRYRQAVEAVGLDYQTMRNYAWVARRFEAARRRPDLSFQHHAEVASVPVEEQDFWLAQAEAFKWSRSVLRGHVRSARTKIKGPETTEVVPKIVAEAERLERWRSAAAQSEMPLQDWIVSCLDRQADETLVQPADGLQDRTNSARTAASALLLRNPPARPGA